MPRLPHGMEITPDPVGNARNAVADRIAGIPLGPAMIKSVDLRRFDSLFPGLQDNPKQPAARDAGLARRTRRPR